MLEVEELTAANACSMLAHYVQTVLPKRLKAQVAAVSRKSGRSLPRRAALAAQDDLLDRPDALDSALRTVEAPDNTERLPRKVARLVSAWRYRDVIAALEFVPVISGEQNDPVDWVDWTDPARQKSVLGQFKRPRPAESDDDSGDTSAVALLIVKSMLLNGLTRPNWSPWPANAVRQ